MLVILAGAGVVPLQASIPGMAAILGSIGLLTWVGVRLWTTARGEMVAYRVLYHADQQPDSGAVTRMLNAVARNAGHVDLIWRFEPGKPPSGADMGVMGAPAAVAAQAPAKGGQVATQSESENSDMVSAKISLFLVAPVSARKALEGMLSGLLPGVWAMKCAVPGPLKPTIPGWAVRAWRWDAASAGRGSLADPLACGIHLGELAAALAAGLGGSDNSTGIREVEVRLKLWAHGWSAVLVAQCDMRQLSIRRPSLTSLRPGRRARQSPQELSQKSPLPFLKPLLWGLTWRWPLPSLSSQPSQNPQPEGIDSGTQLNPGLRERNGIIYREPVYAGLPGRLVNALAANYPLWDWWPGDINAGRARQRRMPPPAVPLLVTEANGSVPIATTDVAGTVVGTGDLFFPATTGSYTSLDSIEAGEVPLPPSYVLPPLPSQILVLGSATCDGRAVGVPALRKAQSTPPASTVSAAGYAASSASGFPARSAADDLRIGNDYCPRGHSRLRLHPMLGEHLLVAGGSDAWRRDVAGALVSQALDMGVTVVAVDGGPPPDEPPSSARKGSQIMSGDLKGHRAGVTSIVPAGYAGAGRAASAAGADPLSPNMLRVSDPALAAKWVAQIDMDNPAGSVHPNMLYVAASPWLPPLQGEAEAASLALQIGLAAQMRFLQAVNVTGMDAGIVGIDAVRIEDNGEDNGPGIAIMEAWLTVLLLRHHRARLILASRGISSSPHDGELAAMTGSRGSASRMAPSSPSFSPSLSSLPSCPDLPALMLVLEQSETLLNLLRRERAAWSDPEWVGIMQRAGTAGERALQAAKEALERAAEVERLDPHDLYLYGAALRGQLKRVVGHSPLVRMLSRPHVSLGDLLHGGAVGAARMLRVNLSGAYRTAMPPYSEDDLARKRYGLYLLWSLWAVSQQRKAQGISAMEATPNGYTGYGEPDPVLLVLHGAGAWFGSGSPLSDPSNLQELGHEGSGIAVAATVSALRHLRAYRARACETFGNLIIGPAPVADMDAPDVTLHLVDQELSILRDGMHKVVEKAAGVDTRVPPTRRDVSHPDLMSRTLNADRLLGVLRRIEEGDALLVTGAPGARKVIFTAHVDSSIANELRASWSPTSSLVVPASPAIPSPAAPSVTEATEEVLP
ncbi:MAG: hypothetical protein IVW55_00495 [Chloroflexi bacterium]|nr:hypothetical protein [Chloroflexota bacterium]